MPEEVVEAGLAAQQEAADISRACLDLIEERRIAEGLSQCAAAKRAGLHSQYWNAVVRGRKSKDGSVPLRILIQMANAVGADIELWVAPHR